MDDDLAIFEAIAAALAAGHEPDLSAFDPREAPGAVRRALNDPESRQAFLAWLTGRVESLSAGRVRVEERPADDSAAPGAGCMPAPILLPVRIVVAGEPFAEPVVLQDQTPVVRFPLRG